MSSFKRPPTPQSNRVKLWLETLPEREVPATLTWKASPTDDDITKAYNYDTETIAPGPDHAIKFTGTTTQNPELGTGVGLTVKKLITDSTFAGKVYIKGELTTYGSTISGPGTAPTVLEGTGTLQLGREDDIGSVHTWTNGRVLVHKIDVGGSAGGSSARLEMENGFDEFGWEDSSSLNIGYIGSTVAAGEVQLKGGTIKVVGDTVDVSGSGKLVALASTTWKDWSEETTASAFVLKNKGEVSLANGVGFTLTKGRYTDATGATGVPKLIVNLAATFNVTLSDTNEAAETAGVIVSKGVVKMYDDAIWGSSDRDVIVENDSKVEMLGAGLWDGGQSKFYINAGSGLMSNTKAVTLKNNARLEFVDNTDNPAYVGKSPKMYGGKLTIGGNFVQDGFSVIKARGIWNNSDKIELSGSSPTATIGGNAKVEAVLKETPPTTEMPHYWENFIKASSVSASSPPYDPGDLSATGWGANWSPTSELAGTNAIRLKFTYTP